MLGVGLQEEKGLADDEARQRDALYERAERLASTLAAIGDSLRDAVADVNAGKPPYQQLSSQACHSNSPNTRQAGVLRWASMVSPIQHLITRKPVLVAIQENGFKVAALIGMDVCKYS